MSRFQTPEELERAADDLLKKHQEGVLEEAAYDLDDESVFEEPEGDEDADDKQTEGDKKGDGEDKDTEKESAKEPDEDDDEDDNVDDDVTEKRIKDAQRKMHEKAGEAARFRKMAEEALEANKKLKEQLEARPNEREHIQSSAKPALTNDEAERLAREYPDLAGFFKSVQQMQIDNLAMREQLQSGITETQQKMTEIEGRAKEQTFMGAIKSIHPDAEEIQGSDEWIGWVEAQPTYIQRAIYEGATAREVADIITSFKRDTGRPVPGETQSTDGDSDGGNESDHESAPQKTSKLERAKQAASPYLPKPARQRPGKSKGKTFSRADIAAKQRDHVFLLSEEGEKWQQEVMKAMRDGRITE